MRIINIVDRFDKVNYGIWNAAIATAPMLKKLFNIDSELWSPISAYSQKINISLFQYNLNEINISELIVKHKLNPLNDIIVTHGCWQYPTKWGCEFQKLGFKWVYVPHGMLEPWSLSQKRFKKWLYFNLIEKVKAEKADAIRAVGRPEQINLLKYFNKTILIPNGIELISKTKKDWDAPVRKYLFMARLHKQKGIIPLIRAWKKSKLYLSGKHQLIIAGPDDGELGSLKKELLDVNNTTITYLGAVYGSEKNKLLSDCHFYLLPSFVEGFPTSVLEAMQFGLIPLISDNCNFPEAFDNKVAIRTNPSIQNITNALNITETYNINLLEDMQESVYSFVSNNYSIEKITQMQNELYVKLLNNRL